MKYKKIIVLLFITALVIGFPSRYAVAKNEEFEDWLNKSYNPAVNNIVKDLNKTIKENWYFNLSDFLIKGNKDATVERMELLQRDLKDLKKDVKAIKIPKTAEKKDKKSVKYTKKQLNKAIKSLDKDSKKLMKKINKDKDITFIAERKAAKKGITKANDEYMALNEKYSIKVTRFKLKNFIKIDESIAKSYINKREKEKKKKKKKIIEDKKDVARQKEIDSWIDSFAEGSVEEAAALVIFEIFDDSYSKPSEIISKLQYDLDEMRLSIVAKGKDGWSDKSIGEGFYMDSTSIYKQLSSDKRLKEVWVSLTFPMQDIYGNVTEDEVIGTWMSRETMDSINWNSFNYQKLLDVVDGKTIYPQFVQ